MSGGVIGKGGRKLRNGYDDVLGTKTASGTFGKRDKPHVKRFFIFSEPSFRFE